MPVGLLKDLIETRPQNVRLLGVDLGTKTIGLAVSDAGQGVATPLKTIARSKFAKDIEAFGQVVQEYEIGGYVFGWPLNMDGSEGGSCDRVRSFIDEMKNYPHVLGIEPGTDLWISLWDERLSTATVDNFLVETVDMSRKRRKEVVDKLAAQVILSGALEFLKI